MSLTVFSGIFIDTYIRLAASLWNRAPKLELCRFSGLIPRTPRAVANASEHARFYFYSFFVSTLSFWFRVVD